MRAFKITELTTGHWCVCTNQESTAELIRNKLGCTGDYQPFLTALDKLQRSTIVGVEYAGYHVGMEDLTPDEIAVLQGSQPMERGAAYAY